MLEAAGHNIKKIDGPETADIFQGFNIFINGFGLDSKRTLMKLIEDGNEDFLPQTAAVRQVIDSVIASDVQDVWKFNADRSNFRNAWHKVWTEGDFDVLLCPGSRAPAVPHGEYGSPPYTALWNLLDVRPCSIPLHYFQTSELILMTLVPRVCHTIPESG